MLFPMNSSFSAVVFDTSEVGSIDSSRVNILSQSFSESLLPTDSILWMKN